MWKKIAIIMMFSIASSVIFPVTVNAVTVNDITSNIYLLEDENTVPTTDDNSDVDDIMDEYDHEQSCEGQDSILGDPSDPNSVAWLLQQLLNFIKIIGPIIVIVLSSIDFIGVIVKGDSEAMAKAGKKLAHRIILAILLFFIPILVSAMLDLFGITGAATCGIE